MTLASEARNALARGDLAAASRAADALIADRPDDADGYFLLGIAAAEAGRIAKAVPLLESAIARGDDPEHCAQLARLLILMRRDGDAAAMARRALDLNPRDARTFDTIGCVLVRLSDHARAIAPFTAAVEAEPDNLDYRYNLAAALGFTGAVEDARVHYEHVLEIDPENGRTHYALAILSRQTRSDNHVDRLKIALGAARSEDDALRIRYALAKELEDLGEVEAFRHLADANARHARNIRYDFAQDAAIFDAIEECFADGGGHGAGQPMGSRAPLFVVGMPRTGTTLVDRILSSHPDVVSAGELQAMPLGVKRLSQTASRVIIDPDTIRARRHIDPAQLASRYMAQAQHHRMDDTRRFVDKLPANFLYIGHIARSFPDAPIVCLRRNPMDTVWSNFKNLFASRSPYYAYSYDLMATARYYARFDRLMRFWDRVFPGRILQLSYEALVTAQEASTRELLSFCGLEWDAACLSFHENKAAVATPSAAQVRRPINSDGMGKWRTHAAALEPVRRWFEDQGIETG
ncbi:sulfotransferase [Croceicoccus sp. YJ47]|uniref:tetratricopeptide repeat-containing sulfotransferase family protein n=1 Tax=Croceicoccus sp. YJ47 TaxID=2798724 RepID=UPI001922527B|nr:sulfotransferase [Croceicoccus sp. YJ47]QQN73744.1 sulfotransferase [Croceicoccus sp. YJ47]